MLALIAPADRSMQAWSIIEGHFRSAPTAGDERFQQEAEKPRRFGGALLHVLQFLAGASETLRVTPAREAGIADHVCRSAKSLR